MEEEEEDHEINSSFRRKKSSVIGNISCCFNGQHHRRASLDAVSFSSPISSSHRRSPSAWFKSKTNDLPEIKGRCRNFISRMGRHRRHSSADFSYDPLSYALNFDDDEPSSDAAIMNFSARLPLSPPPAGRTSPLFDHHLPRSPVPLTPPDPEGRIGAMNDDLRRGFEALSVSMKEMKVVAAGQSSDHESSAAAEVKRSLEPDQEVTPPMGISSNQGILVQLC